MYDMRASFPTASYNVVAIDATKIHAMATTLTGIRAAIKSIKSAEGGFDSKCTAYYSQVKRYDDKLSMLAGSTRPVKLSKVLKYSDLGAQAAAKILDRQPLWSRSDTYQTLSRLQTSLQDARFTLRSEEVAAAGHR